MGGLFGGSPSPPPPPPPPPAPTPLPLPEGDPEVERARRRRIAELQNRSGRQSTILSEGSGGEKLGS